MPQAKEQAALAAQHKNKKQKNSANCAGFFLQKMAHVQENLFACKKMLYFENFM